LIGWLPFENIEYTDYCAACLFGYFVCDTICGFVFYELKQSDIVHHACGLCMTAAAVHFLPLPEWYGRLLSVEFSTILFNLSWLIGEAKGSETAVKLLQYCFALAFFILRVVGLPLMYYELYVEDKLKVIGKAIEIPFVLVILLQWYWFKQIVDKVTGVRPKRSAPKEA
jgi:hypothetical protein